MWFFRSPQIAFGEDALAQLDLCTGEKAFIVTDALVQEMGYVRKVEQQLAAAGLQCACFADVEPDPSLDTVKRCAAQMSAFAPDLVVGLGGGSSLDVAKAAWFLYERPDIELAGVTPFEQFGLRSKAHFVTIPTTAGSGAEVTAAAVITDAVNERKMEVASYELIADLTIVDPQFSASMPAQLTADTGIDVLTHAVEGYTSTFANDFSDALCLHAAWMVFTYLPRAYTQGAADPEAREKMANAATIGALGMGNSHIALAHALGHSAGLLLDLPHGRVTGLMLPYTIEFTAQNGSGRYAGLARILGLPAGDEAEAARSLAQAVRDLLRQVGQPLSLEEAGIDQELFETKLAALCELAEMDSSLATSLRFPYPDELAQLFRCAFEGRAVDF